MKKKLITLIMALVLVCSCSMTTFAATTQKHEYTQYMKMFMSKPQVELQVNRILAGGNRHIKIDWDDVSGADQYVLQIADNKYFANATTAKRLPRQGTYYNFPELDDSYADYYIRVRPVFVLGTYNDRYITMMGRWSNIVFAPCEE